MKFNVGDKVKIREDLIVGRRYGDLTLYNGSMAAQRGKIGFVMFSNRNCYHVSNAEDFFWSGEMLELVKNKNEFNKLE